MCRVRTRGQCQHRSLRFIPSTAVPSWAVRMRETGPNWPRFWYFFIHYDSYDPIVTSRDCYKFVDIREWRDSRRNIRFWRSRTLPAHATLPQLEIWEQNRFAPGSKAFKWGLWLILILICLCRSSMIWFSDVLVEVVRPQPARLQYFRRISMHFSLRIGVWYHLLWRLRYDAETTDVGHLEHPWDVQVGQGDATFSSSCPATGGREEVCFRMF